MTWLNLSKALTLYRRASALPLIEICGGPTGSPEAIEKAVDGGFREMDAKYGREVNPDYLKVADGIDDWLPKRPKEQGNTPEEISLWRDKMFVQILKLHGML